MIDEIDSILSRYLKNWAAHYNPPVDGRERLLEKATDLHAPAKWNSFCDIDYDFRGAEYLYRNSGSWLIGPFSQSRLYSFHITTVFRMAT